MITLRVNNEEHHVERVEFPSGESLYKVDPKWFAIHEYFGTFPVTITCHVDSDNDILGLLMTKDAIDRVCDNAHVDLFLPYIPYSRQDRVCNPGEPLSLKVIANLINSANFHSVTVLDPHSDVATALIDRVRVISQSTIMNEIDRAFKGVLRQYDLLVSPDAGSNKKIHELAKLFGKDGFIRADKKRDVQTGQITETVVYADDLAGKSVLVVDDICEKGGTFIALAKALKAKNCGKLGLAVTHGIFGGEDMFDQVRINLRHAGYTVYTTNSYVQADDYNVLEIEMLC